MYALGPVSVELCSETLGERPKLRDRQSQRFLMISVQVVADRA